MQRVLDAAVFEPAAFQEEMERARPMMIPAESREHLATPCGLLMMELHTSPQVVLKAISTMLEYALEKDTGRFNSPNVGMIMYTIRLAVRCESYVQYICTHAEAHGRGDPDAPPAVKAGVRGLMQNVEKAHMVDAILRATAHYTAGADAAREQAGPAPNPHAVLSTGLPPGWEEFRDDSTGRAYWHHAATGETTWVRPSAPSEPALPKVRTADAECAADAAFAALLDDKGPGGPAAGAKADGEDDSDVIEIDG